MGDPPPPPPSPSTYMPTVFCFRITDIVDTDDPNRFKFMFETLNWSNQNAHGLLMALNEAAIIGGQQTIRPLITSADIDSNGRPIGSGDDDANFPPIDGTGTFTQFKLGQTNSWQVARSTNSMVIFSNPAAADDTSLAFRDLLGAATPGSITGTTAACNLVPGCTVTGRDNLGRQVVSEVLNIETVDNGSPNIDQLPDNVLDGFVLEVENFQPGSAISFNWFLMDETGTQSIGSAGRGNQMGFGTFTIRRHEDGTIEGEGNDGDTIDIPTPPDGRRAIRAVGDDSDILFPGNTGTTQSLREMFVFETFDQVQFSVEPGPGLTAPFLVPQDNILNVSVNSELLHPVDRCYFYGLQDTDLNNSQVFTMFPDAGYIISELGELFAGYDLEGMDMHPHDKELYLSSGDDTENGHPNGTIYKMDITTGGLTKIGETGFGEVAAISFDRHGTLWGWADGEGLMRIDLGNGKGTLVVPFADGVEDMTWNNDGTLLYAVAGTRLYEYKFATNEVREACNTFTAPVEGIDMLDSGELVYTRNNGTDKSIHEFNINTCSDTFTSPIRTDYDDIEGITWVCD
ncbi:hypothetical protein [Candidatus Albibeggiatoa sp. nov. BB20]|uniref:hypothetical protein n=1 Tax=Candidatus Albibeggiatoa sp. nov. BB20 TaxID=3162723 RepID=UPI00336590B8